LIFRLPEVRKHIVDEVSKEATNNLGMGMTYTLFEWVKENVEQLVASQPDTISEAVTTKLIISEPQVAQFKIYWLSKCF